MKQFPAPVLAEPQGHRKMLIVPNGGGEVREGTTSLIE